MSLPISIYRGRLGHFISDIGKWKVRKNNREIHTNSDIILFNLTYNVSSNQNKKKLFSVMAEFAHIADY